MCFLLLEAIKRRLCGCFNALKEDARLVIKGLTAEIFSGLSYSPPGSLYLALSSLSLTGHS